MLVSSQINGANLLDPTFLRMTRALSRLVPQRVAVGPSRHLQRGLIGRVGRNWGSSVDDRVVEMGDMRAMASVLEAVVLKDMNSMAVEEARPRAGKLR